MRWTREHSARKADRRAGQLVSDEAARRTSGGLTDGEVVWSWRSNAGAKVVKTLSRLASDGGNQAMVTGESTYKRVPWKGTVLERVQVPSGKGRSGR